MGQRPTTRDAILALLRDHPEGLTHPEIAHEMGKNQKTTEGCIRYDRERHGTANFRVLDYRPVRGKGGRFQPIIGLGPGEDAKRPRVANKRQNARARDARYREKHRAVIRARTRVRRGQPSLGPFAGLL